MVKCKKGANIHVVLQNAIVAAINDPSYVFALPTLSAWESAVSYNMAEKQRLEFIGDAVMHLSVALYLYQLFPDGTPGLYTNIRSAVNTNATFTHLMVKTGAHELPLQSPSTKAAADSFEVIVAALYMERGFPDVCAWVQEQYAPLIAAARRSYDEFVSPKDHNIKLSRSTKRPRSASSPSSTPLLKNIRLSSRRISPTFMARLMVKKMKSKGKVKLCLPTNEAKLPHEMRLRSCKTSTAETHRPSPLLIDLTVDNHHDPEAPSHVTQALRSSRKPPSFPPMNNPNSATSSNPPLPLTIYHSLVATRDRPSKSSRLLQTFHFSLASERRDFRTITSITPLA
ncbi:hypothetical protein PAXRUDRAFT_23361 [Paxillus rubicundulus Ve08.2h10]|uniref:RNase III domain-containing protein n=1 Tax=Paxillus rubicundulus Ve08.2h10 TaxID=930991 RepID=A0A0D0E5X9_9AGAM|nr:hypothetical protein PAXRUDRAFT_23361 [Paxillus rubicundulus Ve08.2h10]